MASEGAELDLYADDIGDEFSQENEYNDSDLYDDVITSNSKSRSAAGNNTTVGAGAADEPVYNGSSNQSQNSNHSTNSALLPSHTSSNDAGMLRELRDNNRDKKPCVYVGNLTWWTTDDDVTRALSSIGVNDVGDIKFFENRANGQSKGFCVVTLQHENSVRMALEKLPKIELHGQAVQATMCNRQNLNNFEMKSRKPGQNGQMSNNNNNNSNQNNSSSNNNNNQNYLTNNRGGSGIGGDLGGGGGGRTFGQNQNMSSSAGRPPLLPRGPPLGGRPLGNGPLLNNQPRLPQLPHQALQFGTNPTQWSQLMPNGPRPMHNAGGPTLNPMLRMPQGNIANRLTNQPLLSGPASQGDLRVQLSSVGLTGVGQHTLGPAHVNSLFGSQQSLVSSNAGDQFGNRFTPHLNPYSSLGNVSDYGRQGMGLDLQMSEAEFEEILAKNKNLANNAVTRAVSDAASGDYNAAMDTLATAISLISQSRVAHDERCKIVISSLRDTLNGIESKSYSSGGRKDRPRSRERSRERGGSRRDKPRRERSRSREYRERSRDRHYDDRHYEERYREKEGDRREHHRERDHRSSRH